MEFEVALDSGSVVHVCSDEDCMGYLLEDSPGSKINQMFLMGDGGKIPNQGQKSLRLADLNRGVEISSAFQIAKVTRPLMSVGKICDEGKQVVFDKTNHSEGARQGWYRSMPLRTPTRRTICGKAEA